MVSRELSAPRILIAPKNPRDNQAACQLKTKLQSFGIHGDDIKIWTGQAMGGPRYEMVFLENGMPREEADYLRCRLPPGQQPVWFDGDDYLDKSAP